MGLGPAALRSDRGLPIGIKFVLITKLNLKIMYFLLDKQVGLNVS